MSSSFKAADSRRALWLRTEGQSRETQTFILSAILTEGRCGYQCAYNGQHRERRVLRKCRTLLRVCCSISKAESHCSSTENIPQCLLQVSRALAPELQSHRLSLHIKTGKCPTEEKIHMTSLFYRHIGGSRSLKDLITLFKKPHEGIHHPVQFLCKVRG